MELDLRNRALREDYRLGMLGTEIAKKYRVSEALVYQKLRGRILYCSDCKVRLTDQNTKNTRKCQTCWDLKDTARSERESIIAKAKEEKRTALMEQAKKRAAIIKESTERKLTKVVRQCFACKKDTTISKWLSEKNDNVFCQKCRGHLFSDSLSGGRDRTREIRRMWDNHTCQDCGLKWKLGTRRFDVHHLKGMCGKNSTGYDSYETLPHLTTLCHKCHTSKHLIKGRGRRMSRKDTAIRNAEIARLINKKIKTRQEIADWYGFKKSNLKFLQPI